MDIWNSQKNVLMLQRGMIRSEAGESGYDDIIRRIVAAIADCEKRYMPDDLDRYLSALNELALEEAIAFGTPVLTNVGREHKGAAACTVLPLPLRNNQVDVSAFVESSKQALEEAIGTGYDLSETQDPVEELVKMNVAIDALNQEFISANKRPAACMATLRVDHPNVLEFIATKRRADFSQWRFNISLFVTEELFDAYDKGDLFYLRDNQGNVVQSIPAVKIVEAIAQSAHFCGEPGILFKDRFESGNPTPFHKYSSTAPCAEIALSQGEVCQFSYVNLAKMVKKDGEKAVVDWEKIAETVRVITRMLDDLVDVSIQNTPVPMDASIQKRTIGVGITGFADMLVLLGIAYTSEDACKLAEQISEYVDYYSKLESVSLASQRGVFPAYPLSRYTDKEWVKRRQNNHTGIIDSQDWEMLFDQINESGIRNASTTAYPPTGTSSRVVGSNPSFEPFFEHVVWGKMELEGGYQPNILHSILTYLKTHYPVVAVIDLLHQLYDPSQPYVLDDPILSHARGIDPIQHLQIQAAFQRHTDAATSKTINLPNTATVNDVLKIFDEAYKLGLKGLTVFRDGCLDEREDE